MNRTDANADIIKVQHSPQALSFNHEKQRVELDGEALLDKPVSILEHGKSGGLLDDD